MEWEKIKFSAPKNRGRRSTCGWPEISEIDHQGLDIGSSCDGLPQHQFLMVYATHQNGDEWGMVYDIAIPTWKSVTNLLSQSCINHPWWFIQPMNIIGLWCTFGDCSLLYEHYWLWFTPLISTSMPCEVLLPGSHPKLSRPHDESRGDAMGSEWSMDETQAFDLYTYIYIYMYIYIYAYKCMYQ